MAQRPSARDLPLTASRGGQLRVFRKISECRGFVVVRLFGESENTLTNDVSLNLVGAAIDRRPLSPQGGASDCAQEGVASGVDDGLALLVFICMKHPLRANDLQAEIPGQPHVVAHRQFRQVGHSRNIETCELGCFDPQAIEATKLTKGVQLYETLPNHRITVDSSPCREIRE